MSPAQPAAASADEDDLLALDRQLCFALAAASRSVVALYRPVLEPLGLTHPQYLVMLALWERSPRRLSEIAAALHLDASTLSPLVKRLEAIGYLTRGRGETDDRSLAVRLTAAGEALRTEAEKVPPQVIRRLGMSIDEVAATRDALTVLLAAATSADRSVDIDREPRMAARPG